MWSHLELHVYARAQDDAERMPLNEAFFRKVFRECIAYEDVPTVVVGDFNVGPQSATEISDELL